MKIDNDLKIEAIIRKDKEYQDLLNECFIDNITETELSLLNTLMDNRGKELGIAIIDGKWDFIK